MDDLKSDSEDNFSDWEDDEDEVVVKSLFSDARLTSIKQFLIHDIEMFDFNLSEIVSSMKLDNVLLIMLINMIRRRVKEIGEQNVDASFIRQLKEDIHRENLLRDDINMIPIFQDDPVLFLLWDELLKNGAVADDEDDDDDMQASNSGEPTADASEMRDTITKYRNLVASLAANPDVADDSYYFDSYSNVAIHETMLRDEPRTSAYRDALIENSSFMRDKVVLDVGCGTGILCMLAVKAGARKVIGVDNSSIIEKARKIIERNGMSDKITLVKGRLEDVKLPLIDEEVDVIVSEWMGYGLYFENMLSSIIHARDTYLSSNGVLMPSHANIYLEAMTAIGEVDRVAWWGDVYGFDMTDMAELVSREAQVQLVDNEDIISDRFLAHSLDIQKAADADLDFTAPFTMNITGHKNLRAFVISFDVVFAGLGFSKEVILSTGAAEEPTHWKQTVIWLEPMNCELVDAGNVIRGSLVYQRSAQNARDYSINLTWSVHSDAISSASVKVNNQIFKLGS